ncbi:MAG: hypothetical protein HY895_23055 [Deltaproteobacteria bacterium]|nr:hypothetical protein [Deltaproteobacteria bacterium]
MQGHKRTFLSWLFANKSIHSWAFDVAAIDEYVRVFSCPGSARAGFACYRAIFGGAGLAEAKAAARKLMKPVLALGDEGVVGSALLNTILPLGDNVRGGVLAGRGHYLPEECPDGLSRAILDFWRSTGPKVAIKRYYLKISLKNAIM